MFRLTTVPSSLFNSPLLDAELMLLGPVGFLAGTPPSVPDSFLAADLGEPPCSYRRSPALRCSLLKGLGFVNLPARIFGGNWGAIGSFGGLAGP